MTTPGQGELHGNLWRLLVGRTFTMWNTQGVFFQLYLVNELGVTPAAAVAFGASLGLLGMVFQFPAGWISDKLGYRPSFIIGVICCIGGLCCWALAHSFGPLLLVGSIIVMIGWAIVDGLDSAWATNLCTHFRRPEVHKWFELWAARLAGVGMGAGSVTGAILAATKDLRSTVWAQSVVYLPLLLLPFAVHAPKSPAKLDDDQAQPSPSTPQIGEIICSVWARQPLVAIFAFSAVATAATGVAWLELPPYCASIQWFGPHKLPKIVFGILWGAYQCSTFLMTEKVLNRLIGWFGPRGYLAVLLGIFVACYGTLAFVHSVVSLVVIVPIFMIVPLHASTIRTLIGELSSENERASVYSLQLAAHQLAVFLGGLGLAGIVALAGFSASLLTAGILIGGLGGLALWWFVRTERRAQLLS